MAESFDDIDETLLEQPCRYCNNLFIQLVLFDHEEICALRKFDAKLEETDQLYTNEDNPNMAINDDVNELYIESVCNICGSTFLNIVMSQHQEICEALYLSRIQENSSDDEITEINKTEQSEEVENVNESKTSSKTTSSTEQVNKQSEETENAHESKISSKTTSSAEHIIKLNENIDEYLKWNKYITSDCESQNNLKEKESLSKISSCFFEYANENDEDFDDFSDDDCEETLEEFWKRAKEYLQCQRLQNI